MLTTGLASTQKPKLRKQFEVLNKAYAPTGIQYTLQGIDATVDADWTAGKESDQMKKSLRKGDYRTLNLYYVNNITIPGVPPTTIILGQCEFPALVSNWSDVFFKDGCRILLPTLPGGTLPTTLRSAFEGITTVHEVGHWNGLFHTFMGGCNEEEGGDLVCDKPAEAEVSKRPKPMDVGCPVGRDTCRNGTGASYAGVDPIHNYMNYYDE